jgi:uncharacterized membrane protein YfcA
MEIILGLIVGAFIGAVLGFIGAGGAMLTVPILIYGFDFSPNQATTAALAIVFAAALSGAYSKARIKSVLYKEALAIWALGLTTNVGSSLLAHRLSPVFISTGFAVVLILAATSMLIPPLDKSQSRISHSKLALLSLLIGCITGVFGIGGGFIVIPVLVLAFGTPLSIAAGTSLAVISINSLTAFIGHYKLWSEINWSLPLAIALSAVVVAGFASRAHPSINPLLLKRSFAALLYLVALFSILHTWVM